jgi:hypothetical protein
MFIDVISPVDADALSAASKNPKNSEKRSQIVTGQSLHKSKWIIGNTAESCERDNI